MSLIPADIYNRKFKKTFRGYDPQEVDDFLELVAVYYEELISEQTRLNSLVDDLNSQVDELNAELKKYEDLQNSIDETVNNAHKFAEDKKEEAKLSLAEAKGQAKSIIDDAEVKATKIVDKAEFEAERKLMEARDKCEDKYREYKQLLESERLFKIRFKTLLQSHLEMLKEKED